MAPSLPLNYSSIMRNMKAVVSSTVSAMQRNKPLTHHSPTIDLEQLNYSLELVEVPNDNILEGFPTLVNQLENTSSSETVIRANCCDQSNLPPDMRFNEAHIITISAYSCLMVMSAIGNLSVLRSLSKPRVRTAPSRVSLMILHLAIADLLVTFLLMPLEIGWAWTVSWKAGDLACRYMAFFRIFGIFLSSFLLVVISVDRYQSVLRPLTVTEAKKRVIRMLWVAWILSAVFSLPQALIFHVERHPEFTWFEQCVTFNAFPSSEVEMAYNLAGFMGMYFIPMVAIAFCYGSIVFALYRSVGKRQTPSLDRTKTKTLNMTLTIVLAFFLCWTPYNIMSLWYFIDRQSAQLVDRRIQASLFIFAVANSTVNPIVYGYFNCRRLNEDIAKQQLRMRRIVFRSPFRNQMCHCAPVWSSSSDTVMVHNYRVNPQSPCNINPNLRLSYNLHLHQVAMNGQHNMLRPIQHVTYPTNKSPITSKHRGQNFAVDPLEERL